MAWWIQWWEGDASDADGNASDQQPETAATALSFADLRNPFSAHRADPDAQIRALFLASTIWGREHRVARREDETPDEYMRRMGSRFSPIADALSQLGKIYSRLAYAQTHVQPDEARSLQSLWEWMVQNPPKKMPNARVATAGAVVSQSSKV